MNKAIVTGASSGIGKAICRQLAANGWLVYGIGRSFNQSDDIAGIERIVCDITDTATVSYTHLDVYKRQHIVIAPGALYSWLYKQYAEIKAEEITDIDDIANTKDKNELALLAREFYTDDHALWPQEKNDNAMPLSSSEAQKQWQKISRQTRMEKSHSKDSKSEGEQVMMKELSAKRSRRSYKEFLRRFAVLREEVHADYDSFDMGYYAYGLSLYGNMPLIEPLETRETYKIRDFVIVLDTSYSVSGELVEHFLQETFTILTESDSFFVRNKIRIIQCDDSVKTDEEITDEKQIKPLLNKFTLVGGGGTDFRPAFSYVRDLLDKGELKNMCGLIYFTDGKGIFPAKCPSYKCAFVSVGAYEGNEVPPWAMQVELEETI